jgi:membrane protein DedA with SNARE-associated domain
VIGAGAAVENVIPPIPADTFVLIGAFLAAGGRASVPIVFLCTWLPNVASAIGVYAMARRYGKGFFQTRAGHWLLQPQQLEQIGRFYGRWGIAAIFLSRFFPAFRALVPVFAGVTHVSLWKVLPPVAIASGIWYGALVWLGSLAGNNFNAIVAWFDRASTFLLIIAGMLIAAFLVWWRRSRRQQ